MEFNFDLRKVVRADSSGLVQILPQNNFRNQYICEIIDALGRESSRAQGLRSIITSSVRFFSSSDNKIYLKIEGQKVVGILKTGIRKLFYSNEYGKIIEMSPLCLLDFYVHESCQRSGYGKELYECMLRHENTEAHKVAIDRPSSKSLTFMRKHYGLSDYIPQNNNFVIYKQYFTANETRRMPQEVVEAKKENDEFEVYRRKTGTANLSNQVRDARTRDCIREEISKNNSNTPERILNTRDGRRVEETKKNYSPVPPWAVNHYQNAPTTTSSQYGIHSFKNK